LSDRQTKDAAWCQRKSNLTRFLAAARNDAIEHLQHVQRRGKQPKIDRQAEPPGKEKERLKSGDEVAHAILYSPCSLTAKISALSG
jgi:hypothetical protein